MLDGFVIASELEITTCRGVVYLLWFEDCDFYIGSTSQSFRRRYGTISLRDSQLIPSLAVQRKIDSGVNYEVFLHANRGMSDDERFLLEYSLINNNIKTNACLNLKTETENLGTCHPCSLKSPDGVVVDFESVKQARDFIGASNHSQISQVLNGRMLSVCGWTLPETFGPIGVDAHKKPCVLIDPSGNRRVFDSYSDAACIVGVSNNSISALVNGKQTTSKGWTVPGKNGRKHIPLKLISPDGDVVVFPSRVAASEHIGCCNQLVSSLCSGIVKSAKGWVLAELPRMRDGR